MTRPIAPRGLWLLAAVACVLVGWLLFAGGSPRPRSALSKEDVERESARQRLLAEPPLGEGAGRLSGRRAPTGASLEEERRNAAARLDRVMGQVVDESGSAVAGAQVQLSTTSPALFGPATSAVARRVLQTVASAGDGSFTFADVPRNESLRLDATAPDRAPAGAVVTTRGAFVELVLPAAAGLRVRVLDAEALPVAEARVLRSAAGATAEGQTGPDGWSELPFVGAGAGELLVVHPDHRVHLDTQAGFAAGTTHERTIVLEALGRIKGQVLEHGSERPISEAEVRLGYLVVTAYPEPAPVQTDIDGRFDLPDASVDSERLRLIVRHAGYADLEVMRSATDESEVVLHLHPRSEQVLRGTVVGADRLGVADVRIEVRSGAAARELSTTTTRPDGSFVLPLLGATRAGTALDVRAEAPDGRIAAAIALVPREPGEQMPVLDLFLRPSGGIAGQVLDDAGLPVVGARVWLEPDPTSAAPGDRILLRSSPHRTDAWQTASDESGRFAFFALAVAAYRVGAQRDQRVGALAEPIQVVEANVAEVELVLAPGGDIEGRVLGAGNEPVAGAEVRAVPLRGDSLVRGRTPVATTRTNEDGEFFLRGLAETRYRVSAEMPGYRPAPTRDARAGTRDLELVLEAHGSILLHIEQDGRSYEGSLVVELLAQRNRGARAAGSFEGNGRHPLRASAGTARIEALAAGTWQLSATTPGGGVASSSRPIQVVAGAEAGPVHLVLERAASIEGRATDPTRGGDTGGAWIQVVPRAGAGSQMARRSARADAEGHFLVEGLEAGPYYVGIWCRNGAHWFADIEVETGRRHTVELVREAPGRVFVVVTTRDGTPVVGAQARLERDGGGLHAPSWRALEHAGLVSEPGDWATVMTSDAAGRIDVPLVPAGTWRVSATKAGWQTAGEPLTVSLPAGGREQAFVILEPSTAGPPTGNGADEFGEDVR